MTKILSVIVVVLALLLAIQTTRLHKLEERIDEISSSHAKSKIHDMSRSLSGSGKPVSEIARLSKQSTGLVSDVDPENIWKGQAQGHSVAEDNDLNIFESDQFDIQTDSLYKNSDVMLTKKDEIQRTEENLNQSENDREENNQRQTSHRLLADASTRIEEGNFEEAISLLTESIEKDPLNSQSYIRLGVLYRKMGMINEELQVYNDWVNSDSGNSMSHYYMAQAYANQGMNDDAMVHLKTFEIGTGDDVTKIPMVASMYRRLDMEEREGQLLQTWLDKVPDSPDAHRAMASYYRRNDEPDLALSEYERVAELLPGNVNARSNLGNVYRSMGRLDEAAQELLVAAEMSNNNPSVVLNLADVYRMSGDYDAAIDTCQIVVDSVPNSREAQFAQDRIERIEREMNAIRN